MSSEDNQQTAAQQEENGTNNVDVPEIELIIKVMKEEQWKDLFLTVWVSSKLDDFA